MSRQTVKDLKDGVAVEETYLLAEKQLRANRNANLYLLATLRDSTGQISGLMWNVTEESAAPLEAGSYVRVRGKVQLYQGSLQMIVTDIRAISADGLDPQDFQPAGNVEVARLRERLQELLMSIEQPQLRTLMECFFIDDDLMQKYCQAPAGIKAHHAYHGGLVEHVVSMMEVADRIADLYPRLSRDLLLAGVFLHDIGKVTELEYETTLAYSDEGQLLGHQVMGTEMLTEKIAAAEKLTGEDFPKELAWRLKHMILSHHGRPEFGSVKLPMTPEAVVLHHIDNLDAKLHEFTRSIEEDPNAGSSWTPYSARLERKLFKGSDPLNVAEEEPADESSPG